MCTPAEAVSEQVLQGHFAHKEPRPPSNLQYLQEAIYRPAVNLRGGWGSS